MIESLCGHKSFLYTANYMNIGQIPGAPEGAVVETRCLFDAAGVHPLLLAIGSERYVPFEERQEPQELLVAETDFK